MKNGFTVIIMLFTLLVAGSAYAEEINLPAREVYEKAMDHVLDFNGIPTTENEKRMLFKTDKIPMKLTKKEVDCGSMFGISYMSDKRMRTAAIYQVRVRAVNDVTSDIKIIVTIDGYLDTKKGAPFFMDKHRLKGKSWIVNQQAYLKRTFYKP